MRIFSLLSLMLLCAGVFSQNTNPEKYGMVNDGVPEGLKVGEGAPDIQLIDQYGQNFNLREMLKKGPVVLTFYRGNWCPYCSKYLTRLVSSLKDIQALGGKLIAVTPEAEAQVVRTSEEHGEGEITLLSDTEGKIMKAYDVDFKVTDDYQAMISRKKELDIADHNTQEVAVLPVAATYVINQDGMITYRHFKLDYSERAPIEEILEALKKLQ